MKREKLLIILLVVLSLAIRVFRLNTPPTYMFDEVYHAFTAEAYARNDPQGYEWWHQAPKGFAYEWLHPPLAKLIQAGSIKILGDHPFAWRFPGTIFAAATVALLYFFGKSLFKSSVAGLIAAYLYALDGLSFVQSRITMNDIYVAFFIVLSFYLFWRFWEKRQDRRRLVWVGLALGLSIGTKWSGFYGILILGLLWLAGLLKDKKITLKNLWLGFWCFAVIPGLVYLLSYSQFWLQGHTWAQFVELHHQIWWYQTNLKATHPYQSGALTWPLMYRPVWYYVNYGKETLANIYAMGNPAIWWPGIVAIGWIVVILLIRVAEVAREIFMRYKKYAFSFLKNLRAPRNSQSLIIVLLGYFGFFLPWAFSPRILFLYHYLPSVPFLCLALGFSLDKIWPRQRLFVYWYLFVVALVFVYFYPQLSGLPVPKWWAEQYFWFPSWK